MKLWGVDVGNALARGFEIALVPALTASLVSYMVRGWIEAQISWEWLGELKVIVGNSVCASIMVSLVFGLLVFIKRAVMASGRQTNK